MADDGAVDTAPPSDGGQPRKGRFTMPSAYTILFALIVITALATWIIPAGLYESADDLPALVAKEPA